jgi:hypothetical protein
MKNILCMIVFLGFIFNLNATSRDFYIEQRVKKILEKNLIKKNLWAVAQVKCVDGELNIIIIHPFTRPHLRLKSTPKQKEHARKKPKIVACKQKLLKAKKYNLFQPMSEDFIKITKNKEKNIIKSPNKEKIKLVRSKKNKLNRQQLRDKKMNWLNYEDYDNEIIIFNHKEIGFYEESSNEDRQIVLYEESFDEELEEGFCEEEYDYWQERLLNNYDKRQQRNYRLSSEKKNFL